MSIMCVVNITVHTVKSGIIELLLILHLLFKLCHLFEDNSDNKLEDF